jgi:hypothetical protein
MRLRHAFSRGRTGASARWLSSVAPTLLVSLFRLTRAREYHVSSSDVNPPLQRRSRRRNEARAKASRAPVQSSRERMNASRRFGDVAFWRKRDTPR